MKYIIQYFFLALLLCQVIGFQKTKEAEKKDEEWENPIKYVIVLGMENQSYDRLFGYMDAPIGELQNKSYCNEFEGKQYCTKEQAKFVVSPDPFHSYEKQNQAIFGTTDFPPDNSMEETMSWFARNQGVQEEPYANPQDMMDSFRPEDIPVLSTLAKEFKTTDQWFCSLPSCTEPNKFFYHIATSRGNVRNCDGWYCSGYPMEARSIYENLEDEGFTWAVHWMDWNEAFAITPLNKKFYGFVYDQGFDILFKKIDEGKLDNYTFLIPRCYWAENQGDDLDRTSEDSLKYVPNSEHPEEDIRAGEWLIKRVYEKLRKSKYWEQSLLVINYDENGGFFDHVPPPDAVNPSPEDESIFEFKRYGPRVPGVVISPWLKKGVDSKVYDHTSVPKTIKEIFNLKSDYLSERDKSMNSFVTREEILDKPRDDCPLELPDIPNLTERPLHINEHVRNKQGGTLKNQLYLLGTRMVQEGKLSKDKYKAIIDRIGEQRYEAQIFIQEVLQILGYIPMGNEEFKYLSKNEQENL